jgi:hypothetical protein
MGSTGPLYEKQDPLLESFLYHQMHEFNNPLNTHTPPLPPTTTNVNPTLNLHKSYSSTTLESEYGTPNNSNSINSNNSSGRMDSGMTWNSIVPQQDFAISVWKGTSTPGLNYLVECNDRFLDLVGYSLEILKNNFPCQKLFVSKAFSNQKVGKYKNF